MNSFMRHFTIISATVICSDVSAFCAQKQLTLDFDSNDQLALAPSWGDDPSYVDGGKLVAPILPFEHKGMGRRMPFKACGAEPTAATLSFDIMLDGNFQKDGVLEVGKLPGFEGIYDESAGWGGNPVVDEDSWSVRIAHVGQMIDGEVPIGLYVYHPYMPDQHGTTINAHTALKVNQNYRLDLTLELNDVGKWNGVIRLDVDGTNVYSDETWMLRLKDSVKIRSAWLDVYIGGATPSLYETTAKFDNLTLSWSD